MIMELQAMPMFFASSGKMKGLARLDDIFPF